MALTVMFLLVLAVALSLSSWGKIAAIVPVAMASISCAPDDSLETPIETDSTRVTTEIRQQGVTEDQGGGAFTCTLKVYVDNTGSFDAPSVDAWFDMATLFTAADTVYTDTAPSSTEGVLTIEAGFDYDQTTLTDTSTVDIMTTTEDDTLSFILEFEPGGASMPIWVKATSGALMVEGDGTEFYYHTSDSISIYWDTTPVISLSKSIGSITDNGDGTYTAAAQLIVTNIGPADATNLQVADSLDLKFTAFGSITTTSSSGLSRNASFDGTTDYDLYAAAQTLTIGSVDTLDITGIAWTPASLPDTTVNTTTAEATSATDATASATGIIPLPAQPATGGIDIVTDKAGYVVMGVPFSKGEASASEFVANDWHIYKDGTALTRDFIEVLSTWNDNTVKWVRIAFLSDEADTFQLQNSTYANSASDKDFSDISWPCTLQVKQAGEGAFTNYVASEKPALWDSLTTNDIYSQAFTTVDADSGLKFEIWHREYQDGSSRSWVTMYNSNKVTGGDGSQRVADISDFDGDAATQLEPEFRLTAESTTSFAINNADDMYQSSSELSNYEDADTTVATLWYDGMVDVDSVAGGWTHDIKFRNREKVTWDITFGGGSADPVYAYCGLDTLGNSRYVDSDVFGRLADFNWDTGDSLAHGFEWWMDICVNTWYGRYANGNTPIPENELWNNPRMAGAYYKDWDTGGSPTDAWYERTHNWGQEYEYGMGLICQWARVVGFDTSSLPNTGSNMAPYVWELAKDQAVSHYDHGWWDGEGEVEETPGWRTGAQWPHPGHEYGGLVETNRPGDQGGLGYAHWNGRNVLFYHLLTGDPVAGAKAQWVAATAKRWKECYGNASPTAGCGGSCGNCLWCMEHRAPANFIWLLMDWYSYSGDLDYSDTAWSLVSDSVHGPGKSGGECGSGAYPYARGEIHDQPFMIKPWMAAGRMVNSIKYAGLIWGQYGELVRKDSTDSFALQYGLAIEDGLLNNRAPYFGYFPAYEYATQYHPQKAPTQIGNYWYNTERGSSAVEVANALWGFVADSTKALNCMQQGLWYAEGGTNGPDEGYGGKGGIITGFILPDEGQWVLSRSVP